MLRTFVSKSEFQQIWIFPFYYCLQYQPTTSIALPHPSTQRFGLMLSLQRFSLAGEETGWKSCMEFRVCSLNHLWVSHSSNHGLLAFKMLLGTELLSLIIHLKQLMPNGSQNHNIITATSWILKHAYGRQPAKLVEVQLLVVFFPYQSHVREEVPKAERPKATHI